MGLGAAQCPCYPQAHISPSLWEAITRSLLQQAASLVRHSLAGLAPGDAQDALWVADAGQDPASALLILVQELALALVQLATHDLACACERGLSGMPAPPRAEGRTYCSRAARAPRQVAQEPALQL